MSVSIANGKWTCSKCGSNDVEVKLWINPNNSQINDDIELVAEELWCNQCDEQCELLINIDGEEYKASETLLRLDNE